jgi:16S rRNA (guanine(966)-N(2))-methyltransferase RsmD
MSSLRVTAGTLRGRRVPVPLRDVRPTSERARQAYFNIVGARIEEARFLDLFAGSGIFSLEAISRGATSSMAIEENQKNAAAIERLAKEWQAPVTVIARDVFDALPRLKGMFDLVYADPPYDFGRYDELVRAISSVTKESTLVAIEHRVGAAFSRPDDDHGRLKPAATREYGEVSITFFAR